MGFWLAVQIGIVLFNVGYGAYTYYSAKKEQAAAKGFDPFSLPRATEGDAVPKVYGTVRLDSVNLVAFADAEGSPNTVDDVGLEYGMDARLILCLSNDRIDAPGTHRASFIKLFVGDKEVTGWQGGFVGIPEAEGCTRFAVNDEDVLGGNVLGGGGRLAGNLLFYDGSWNQEIPAIDGYDPGGVTNTPNYRGFVGIKLRSFFVGLSPNLAPLSPVVFNPITIPGFESTSGPVGMGDVNPAAVLYDLLTSGWGGVGNEPILVDADSFAAAAAVLQDEQHGISLKVSASSAARAVIEQVLKQIDAVLYEDPVTRRYVLSLIREDYVVEDLPVFDQSNIVTDPAMPQTMWEGAVNEVRVMFTDANRGWKTMPSLAHDLALINASGGRRRTAEIHLPGVTSAALAYTLAQRHLNYLARPLAKLELTVNRAGYDLVPGQPFVFTYPHWLDANGVAFTGVFRVEQPSTGTLEDGRVTFVATQDRFAIGGRVFDPPGDEISEPAPTPDPIIVRTITEAPRWIQLKQYELGLLANVDAQRSYTLATPEGSDSRYKVQASINGGAEVQDAPARPFPGTFEVDLAYARTISAYDTTTGLRIRNVAGWTPTAATPAEIATQGANLILVAHAHGHEILSFETATPDGNYYILGNVGRGCLDTVPADLAAGDAGYLLPGSYAGGAIGTLALVHGADVVTHTQAAAGSTWVPSDDSPEDAFTARSRTLLPYPGANLTLNGSKTPAAIEEGGVDVAWQFRDRLRTTITRGDATNEALETGTAYAAVAVNGDPVTPGDEVLLESGAGPTLTDVPLGAAGHGLLEVGVRTELPGALPDGTTPTLYNWQTPLLSVQAHHWRNLLINGDFADGLTGWETVSGTPSVVTGGAAGTYLTGSGGTVIIRQDVPVSGYLPKNYGSLLDFDAANLGDAGDTVTVQVQSLSAAGVVLATQSYGASDPGTNWTAQTVEHTDLHDDTATLRVQIVLTPVGEDFTPDVGVKHLRLRLGQYSAQLLVNGSFEASIATGWTESLGTWQALTATKFDGSNYVRPNDGAAAQLRQDVAIPTGFEGSVAILEGARMNDAADDTGTITLAARDGSGALATSQSATEAITPTNTWARRRVVIEPVPAATTTLRVQLDAARVTGTPLNACFDALRLRCFKALDPDVEIEIDFSERAEQALPRTVFEWKAAFPDVTPPDYAIFDGGVVGRLGVEPLMEADTGILTAGDGVKVVQAEPKRSSTTGYENPARADRDVHTSPTGTAFANWGLGDPFSALTFFKVNELPWTSTACGLLGRIVDGVGWGLGLDDDGKPAARIIGADGQVDIVGGSETADGSLHGVGFTHDPLNDEAFVVDASGIYIGFPSAAGEFRAPAPGRFRLLRATDDTALDLGIPLPGQLVRGYLWRRTVSTADMQAVIQYAEHLAAWGTITTTTRGGSIACVVGTDDDGVIVETFGPGRLAQALHEDTGRLGLVSMPDVTNLAPATFDGTWLLEDATVELAAARDPRGYKEAAALTDDGGGYYILGSLALGAAGVRHVAWFARASAAASGVPVLLRNNTGSTVASTTVDLATTWQRFTWSPTWTGATSGVGQVAFGADAGATVYLSPIVLVSSSTRAPAPGTVPIGAPGATISTVAPSPTSQFNREGEIEIEAMHADQDGTLVNVANNSNSNDRRLIRWNETSGSHDLEAEHWNGSGASDTAAELAGTTIDEAQPYVARLRWNRAGLVDGLASAFTALRAEQPAGTLVAQDAGRVVTFTASTTPIDVLELGHNDGSDVLAGLIFGVTLRAREEKF